MPDYRERDSGVLVPVSRSRPGKNAKHGKLDFLPEDLRDTVDQMLLSGRFTYADIISFLGEHDVGISTASVCRYARNLRANAQILQIAQTNFERAQTIIKNSPEKDISEVLLHAAGHQMFNALSGDSEFFESMKPVDIIRQSTALARAVAYKRSLDLRNKTKVETGYEAVAGELYEAMAKENPALYAQLKEYIAAKQAAAEGGKE